MAILSFRQALSDTWSQSNNAKGMLWCGIGIIFLIQMALGLVDSFYLMYLVLQKLHITQPLTLESYKASVIDVATIVNNDHYYKIFHNYFMVVYTIVTFVMYALYTRLGIFVGANLPVAASDIFKNFFSFKTLKIAFVYIIEFVIAFFTIIFFTLFFSHENNNLMAYCFMFIAMCFFYLSARCYLILPSMFIENIGLQEACKKSFALTKGNGFKIILIKIFALLIFVVSILPLFIGLIWAVPFIAVLRGSVWKQATLT